VKTMDRNIDETIAFLLQLKLESLQRNHLATLTYEQVSKTIYNTKWQGGVPAHLNRIAQDINEITVEDVVNYLTKENITTRKPLEQLVSEFEGE